MEKRHLICAIRISGILPLNTNITLVNNAMIIFITYYLLLFLLFLYLLFIVLYSFLIDAPLVAVILQISPLLN